MKKFAKKDKRSELQKEYDEAVKLLKAELPGTDAYLAQLDIVERLNKMLMDQEDRKKKINPDTIVNGGVGLLQIGAILFHEQFHNITTKAFGLVKRMR